MKKRVVTMVMILVAVAAGVMLALGLHRKDGELQVDAPASPATEQNREHAEIPVLPARSEESEPPPAIADDAGELSGEQVAEPGGQEAPENLQEETPLAVPYTEPSEPATTRARRAVSSPGVPVKSSRDGDPYGRVFRPNAMQEYYGTQDIQPMNPVDEDKAYEANRDRLGESIRKLREQQ